jgi:hypothetical protein
MRQTILKLEEKFNTLEDKVDCNVGNSVNASLNASVVNNMQKPSGLGNNWKYQQQIIF